MNDFSDFDFQRAPCLREGAIAENGRALVEAARSLGDTRRAGVLRAWCVPYLFEAMETVFDSPDTDPVAGINDALARLAHFLKAAALSGFPALTRFTPASAKNVAGGSAPGKNGGSLPVEEETGEHYGQLFRQFSDSSYWDEPARLLRERLERNGIPLSAIQGKSVLDVGCGGGRYSAAWRLLGAGRVLGYDVSATGIADARRRVEAAGIEDVFFREGNVLSLPFVDDSFDIVYSNGVLHHTTDWETGVRELVRVLNAKGFGWLYLIENPGGLFWDAIEILRVILAETDKELARRALQIIGVPANRIFYMLDHVMVPINVRLAPEQIESCLHEAGAADVRRLERGTDFDRIEQIYQNKPHARVKYGAGENRYVFSKHAS